MTFTASTDARTKYDQLEELLTHIQDPLWSATGVQSATEGATSGDPCIITQDPSNNCIIYNAYGVNIIIDEKKHPNFPFNSYINDAGPNIGFMKDNKYKIFTCNICDIDFEDNHIIMLECFHAYCFRCCSNIHQVQCPHCRAPFKILYEINNFKSNCSWVIKKYTYQKKYYNIIKETELFIDVQEECLHFSRPPIDINTLSLTPIVISKPYNTTLMREYDYANLNHNLNQFVCINTSSHPTSTIFDDTTSSIYYVQSIVQDIASPLDFTRNFDAFQEFDGICLILAPKKRLDNDIDYILGVKSIIFKYNQQDIFNISGYRLLHNILVGKKEDITMALLNKDTIVLNISARLLFGIDDEAFMYGITQLLQQQTSYPSVFSVNLDETIYDTTKIHYKIKGKCYDFKKYMSMKNIHMPFPTTKVSLSSPTVNVPSSYSAIISASMPQINIFILSPIELKQINLFINGRKHVFEDIMTLRYYDASKFFYTINFKPFLNFSSIMNATIILVPLYVPSQTDPHTPSQTVPLLSQPFQPSWTYSIEYCNLLCVTDMHMALAFSL